MIRGLARCHCAGRAGLNPRGGGIRIAKDAKGRESRENRGRADVHTRGAEPSRWGCEAPLGLCALSPGLRRRAERARRHPTPSPFAWIQRATHLRGASHVPRSRGFVRFAVVPSRGFGVGRGAGGLLSRGAEPPRWGNEAPSGLCALSPMLQRRAERAGRHLTPTPFAWIQRATHLRGASHVPHSRGFARFAVVPCPTLIFDTIRNPWYTSCNRIAYRR